MKVVPGTDPDDPFSDPIIESNDLKNAGFGHEAYKLLMDLCRSDLRCLHGYGLCLWRQGLFEEARQVFVRMLWLNPRDNLGARFLLHYIENGKAWEEFPGE